MKFPNFSRFIHPVFIYTFLIYSDILKPGPVFNAFSPYPTNSMREGLGRREKFLVLSVEKKSLLRQINE
jgi:hypothetical protein